MEHYICHKVYIPKTRSERISDTVDFTSKQFIMPKMFSTDATFHYAQHLIYALQNPAPAIPLVKLENRHEEALTNPE